MHKTYKGRVVDMDSIRKRNEDQVAVGNMRVNARGDKLGKNGEIIEKAGDVNRKHYKTSRTTVSKGSTKKPVKVDANNEKRTSTKEKPKTETKKKETELDNGDIVIDEDKKEK